MTATTLAPHRPRLDLATGDLVFRVSGPGRSGQVVRLKSAKCTIGAGRNCTLRLKARGVAPVHCMILRGRNGAVVRRWSPDTRLNHESFTDAPLAAGDQLSVGPIELEVLSAGVSSAAIGEAAEYAEAADDATNDQPTFNAAISLQLEELDAGRAAFEADRKTLETQREQLLTDLTDVENQRRSVAADRDTLSQEKDSLAESRRAWEAERERQASLLAAEADRLNGAQPQLESDRQLLNARSAQLDADRADLDHASDALAADRNALAADRNALNDERNAFAEACRQRDAAQETRLAQFEADRNALSDERHRIEEQRKELTAWQTKLESQSEASAKTSATSACDTVPPVEPEPTTAAPVDLAEVLRKFGVTVDASEDAVDQPQVATEDAHVQEPASQPPHQPAIVANQPSHVDADEESIDDYMSRLMQRVRSPSGGSTSPARAASQAAPTVVAASAPIDSVANEPTVGDEVEPAVTLPAAPRARVPEKRSDLSTLRELANFSAHSALKRHGRQVLIDTMYSKLLVAGVALVAGIGLLWMWKQCDVWEVTFYSGLVALIVAGYWGVEYALLTGRLMVSKSGHINWNLFPSLQRPASTVQVDEETVVTPDREMVKETNADHYSIDASDAADDSVGVR